MNENKLDQINDIDKEKPNEEFDFLFLTDQPLSTDKELADPRFGHKEIAQALVKSIEKCPTPFTIGLFGKWGSGKSSIANLLKKDLQKKNIPVVIFDVWKHQGDALRRTFLIDLHKQLCALGEDFFNINYPLSERIESTQSRETQGKFKINWGKIKQIFTGQVILSVLLFVLFIAILIDILIFKGYMQAIINGFVVFGSFVTGGIFLTLISKFMTEFITTETITINTGKFQDPREFENEFGELIKQVKNKRLLVVFDNLDRVTHKRAVEVLATIKTFLEPKDLEIAEKEVVFVIPCDADAIRKHIENVYKVQDDGNSAFSQEEFLKKFFNTVFWIPEFIPSELEVYTREMLKQTGVKDLDNDKVAWIITKAFRENPRQIKQFINILLANYILVRERQGEGGDFPKNFLKENTSQLTNFLLLYQKFPKDMEKLRKSRRADLQDAIDNTSQIGFEKDFLEFAKETISDFPTPDVRIFFTLRRSEHEKKFSGIEDFFIALEDKKIDSAIAYLKSFKNYTDIQEEFSQVIKDRLENITNDLSLASSISTLLEALDNIGIRLTEVGYGEVVHHLENKAAPFFHTFSPSTLTNQIAEPLEQYRDKIINKWHDVFIDQKADKPTLEIDDDYWKKLLDVILNNNQWFESNKIDIQEVLSKRLASSTWVSQLFRDKPEQQKKFLSSQFAQVYINSVSNSDIEKNIFQEKVEILCDFEIDILKDSYGHIINKFNELLANENNQPLDAEREPKKQQVLENITKVLDCLEPELKVKININEWEPFVATAINGINSIPDVNTRKLFIPLLLTLNNFIQEPRLSESKQIITSFFNEASTQSIDLVFKKLKNEQSFIESPDYIATFETRSLNDQLVFDFLYDKISDQKKSGWLIKLLERDQHRFFEKIKNESYKLPDVVMINKKLLDMIINQPVQQQPIYFEAINTMKCARVKEQKDQYLNILKNHTTSLDINFQKLGFDALSGENFLGKERQRILTKEVFDWLKKPEVSNKHQQFAIQTIMRGIGRFTDEEKRDFTLFVLEELIRKSRDETAIRFGFDQLAVLNPKYQEYRSNYNDIRYEIEHEQDSTFKNVLIQGLKRLVLLQRKNKTNREFWEWVEALNNI